MGALPAGLLGDRSTGYRTGLLGAGIATSASPHLHEREAAAHGRTARYVLLDTDDPGIGGLDPAVLLDEVHRAGWQGLGVTHPCKQSIVAHLDGLSADAAAIGAVNHVVFGRGRAVGHNTDWSGYARSLRDGLPGGLRPDDLARVVLVGAGGAGAAVAHALLTLGVAALDLVDVSPARSGRLAEALAGRFPDRAVRAAAPADLGELVPEAAGLVNASPVGMVGHPGTPVPADLLRGRPWVSDVVYRPRRTRLLADAEDAGCRVVGGGAMLVHQAADGFALMTGLPPDRARMLGEFERIRR